ncbi:S1-like domain-containing protein [Meloidogyne graminicola]|uniref:S1-like domain-containing protein n=1 Tax=Meloidogyne graminicola TaxID=189291 RepID=A0A8S9ZP26_9BILA|nr:S1-like domain-containing protein [Meloidogyne graminicola]
MPPAYSATKQRRGKNSNKKRKGSKKPIIKSELIEKDSDMQVYAKVQAMLGNCHLIAFCFDEKCFRTRLCRIRGKLRKRTWIRTGDIILVSKRDYQDYKADVILKYSSFEVNLLRNSGELPKGIIFNNDDYDDDVENRDKEIKKCKEKKQKKNEKKEMNKKIKKYFTGKKIDYENDKNKEKKIKNEEGKIKNEEEEEGILFYLNLFIENIEIFVHIVFNVSQIFLNKKLTSENSFN